ncbi:unnamed protein product [Didymodactylos carnosus]|uniref:Uncharacterized protein n=1 Tax=Didymodactylos carnosus TaxID=1234261 RepID=A0A814DJ02_9BILA|nr:unnamed protein product [Didymodactylos carnosus]CAF0955071.1 unnamed protein product [Didymodactylos carnosus]CAF3682082.1 unnamed protein product [Didymodactylos carnosus]CAF3730257.1 unnamed protein product [Didymodactylos carnosus]
MSLAKRFRFTPNRHTCYAILQLLCYKEANLDGEHIIYEAIQYDETNNYMCLFFMLYVKSKYYLSVEWKQIGDEMLDLYRTRMAIFCFHTARLSTNEFVNHLDALSSDNNYNKVASLLIILDKIMSYNDLMKIYCNKTI